MTSPNPATPSPEAMTRAANLSKRGFPAPNPQVGCVIVQGGEVVGEGYHDHAGGPHAEVVALRQAGERARNADLYVTLEPCNATGRTPACAPAIVAAGIRRVFYAVADPNPKMAGGAAALRAAGLICEPFTPDPEAIEAINRPWLFAMRNRRPFFVLKAAVSLDGRIALPNGESKWITSERARRAAHRLRADLGAVLVGRRTVGLDNPSLTARISGVVNQPTRIVLDPHQRLSEHHAVFDSVAPTLRVVSQAERPGDLPTRSQNGSLDLNELASLLFERGITGVLVEGGAHTHAAFVKAGLVDRIHLFIAPKLLGEGPSWLADFGIRRLEQAPSWQRTGVKTHGPDLEIVLEPAQNLTT